MPPLKIVIAGASLEEQGSGRAGKNGSSRHHLPYVVSTSSGGEGESVSSPQNDDHEHSEHGKRVLRSHRYVCPLFASFDRAGSLLLDALSSN